MENIRRGRGRRAPYDSHSSCPLSLLCLQVSSTPNLIALISQLNMGRQKKDNSHPFWGRIRGICAREDAGGGKDCPVVVVEEEGGLHNRSQNVCVHERDLPAQLLSLGKTVFQLITYKINQSFDLVTRELTRLRDKTLAAAFVSHTSDITHSSEQLDKVGQVTWVIRLGECEALTVAH